MASYVIYNTTDGKIQAWHDDEPKESWLDTGEAFLQTPLTFTQGKYYKVDLNSKTVFEIVYAPTLKEDWSKIRQARNALLTSTDYVLTPDYPIDPALLEEVKAYRTALRNITETYSSPDAVVWPVNPLDKPKA
jgi:hypothetical protein